jgi:hypothetical protein
MSAHASDEIGDLWEVLTISGGSYATFYIAEHEYPGLDAAWADYVDSGRARDKLLQLETQSGSTVTLAISTVMSIEHSTRESRRAWRRRSEAFKAEQQADVGYTSDD